MEFHEKYLDVLQNLEFAIIQVFHAHPELIDHDVINALEALASFFIAEKNNRPPRNFSLSNNAKEIFDNVKDVCHWRLGRRAPITIDQPISLTPLSLDEIINCIKKIHSSAKWWNKERGRQGYLQFVSQFVK
ncbi:hypothetical protein JW964_27485 [candidate division KSB1 bacterium]|nr:hypothetical protein [candidate division KSB1 bacterium]